jgi:uncharacterized protein (DUF488 family)
MPDNELMDGRGRKSVIFALGYEGTEINEFISRLTHNGITSLIDVCKIAISSKKGFPKTKLSEMMSSMGIDCYQMPELGIASSLRKLLDGSRPEIYSRYFYCYE